MNETLKNFPYGSLGKIQGSYVEGNDLIVWTVANPSEKIRLQDYSLVDWTLTEFLTQQGRPATSLSQLQSDPRYSPGPLNPFRLQNLNTESMDDVLSESEHPNESFVATPSPSMETVTKVEPTGQPVPLSDSEAPKTVSGVAVQTQQREGNDLVIYYPNGAIDRYRNYYSPLDALKGIASGSSSWKPKEEQSRNRVGDDVVIRFVDGSQKVFTNWFLPSVPDQSKLNDGAYPYGTAFDPEKLAFEGTVAGKPWLVSDRRDVNDRVLYYSDGSSKRLSGWYVENPGYAEAESGIPAKAPNFSDVSKEPIPIPDIYIQDPREIAVVKPVVSPTSTGQPIATGQTQSSFANPQTVDLPLTGINPSTAPSAVAPVTQTTTTKPNESGITALALVALAVKFLILS